jgi:hypothetical protein
MSVFNQSWEVNKQRNKWFLFFLRERNELNKFVNWGAQSNGLNLEGTSTCL